MTELTLEGCRPAPLGAYLTGLGLLRAVTRTVDPGARGHWRAQRFVLVSRVPIVEALVDELAQRFVPESIVSPWNAGSGFAANGRNATAEQLLQRVRESTDARLDGLRAAVRAGDHVVATGRARGWGGKGDELWDKAHKRDVLLLCRNTFPDEALAWVDAAVALGGEAEPTYSRLLGTGGNFGRQDLSVTYLNRALSVIGAPKAREWLRAALTGDETVPYLRDAVGQFDPSRAGGVQSSPWEKADDKGFVNPWSFLLTLEGALLFAGAVVRRTGAQFSRPALPFQVHGSTGGFATDAPGEASLGEIWVPEWSAPAGLAEIGHLLAEGRAEWRDAPARSGLDFARAVATLGIDRGLAAFTRHVFVDRLGQNPLAVPAGRIEVRRRGQVGLLGEIDPWLARLRGDTVPAGVATGVRRVEQRLFDLATGEGGLVDTFAALGLLVEAVGRSGRMRDVVHPMELRSGDELRRALQSEAADDLEVRLALAFATGRDTSQETSLRGYLQPVRWERTWWVWSGRPVVAPVGAGIGPALAEVARRRGLPGAVPDPLVEEQPGVRGSRIAWRHGLIVDLADRQALVHGTVDGQRLAALLAGLLCVRWPEYDRAHLPGHVEKAAPDPAVDLLLPFTTAGAEPLLVRPGSAWPALLAAGRIGDVLDDARRRLVVAGCGFVVEPAAPHLDPHLTAASLMLASSASQRVAARDRVTRTEEDIPA